LKTLKTTHGGKREGAGKPKGTKNASTISKEQAREALRAVVMAHMQDMLRAQIAHAKGIGHLFTRDKSGKFTKIENETQIDQLLTEGTEHEDYWIFAKDPSVQAFTDLMNRALDKPKEQQQDVAVEATLTISWED
jgi:hypothetical protein